VAGCTSVASFASIAEFETEIRKERQMEGIAKAKGVQFGRKPKLQEREIDQLRRERENGAKISELMSKYSISKASVYRLLA
jgi:DNA invertase Pin-like site-specific DNA recombinase